MYNFRKRKAESEAALTVRADGLSPNQVAVRMKRTYESYETPMVDNTW